MVDRGLSEGVARRRAASPVPQMCPEYVRVFYKQAAAQTAPRLRDVAPHVPAAVASIVERAMALDPADRYQTVADFSAALGSRSTKPRRWRRTNEHAGHLGCWRGERPGKRSYILCLEQGATPKQCTVTTRHATGAKVPNGSRTAPMRDAATAVRATIDKLS